MKPTWLSLLFLLCVPMICGAANTTARERQSIQSLVSHYLGPDATIDFNLERFYLLADLNRDGLQDMVILFKPGKDFKPRNQLRVSTPWGLSKKNKPTAYHTSLLIVNGHVEGMQSKHTSAHVWLDNAGVLETPAFKLILVKTSDNDYPYHQAKLPVKTKGDILLLPTEAGIDTYAYWKDGTYRLFIPDE